MSEQEIRELILLAHMHKAILDQEGFTPNDQTYRFVELARKAALALADAQRRPQETK